MQIIVLDGPLPHIPWWVGALMLLLVLMECLMNEKNKTTRDKVLSVILLTLFLTPLWAIVILDNQ